MSKGRSLRNNPEILRFEAIDELLTRPRPHESEGSERQPRRNRIRGLGITRGGTTARMTNPLLAVSTALIVVIIVVAVIVLALLAFLGKRKRVDQRRTEAGEHREQAQKRSRQAELAEAEAQERAARAKRESLAAEAQADKAQSERAAAADLHERAREIDPDQSDEDEGEHSPG